MHYHCPFCEAKIESSPKGPVIHSCIPEDKELTPFVRKALKPVLTKDLEGNEKTLYEVVEKTVPRIRRVDKKKRGTFVSLETANDVENNLVQIQIIRKYEKGQFTLTITERTKEEIAQYLKDVEEENRKIDEANKKALLENNTNP